MLMALAVLLLSNFPVQSEQSETTAVSALREHVGWSIAHEGCPVYGRTAPSQPADTMLPAAELRQCFLSVQEHNPVAYHLIQTTPDPALIQITREAVETDKAEYQIRENLEWVLTHEGQLSYFRDLANNGNFAAIRSRYKQLQSHNPNAVNALNTLSDSEIGSALNEERVSIVANTVDADSLKTIATYTQPTSTTLTKDTTLGDLTQQVYGSSATAYFQALASSNAILFSALDPSNASSFVIKDGTTVVVPSLPTPGRAGSLSLKKGVSVSVATAALNSLPNVTSEASKTGHIEVPASATLQSTTINTIPEHGAQWYVQSICADKVKRGDLSFPSLPVVAVVGVVDGGVDASHPLIKPVLWPLPPELATASWPAGSIGYDFYADGSDPVEELEDSHGTHVTGLATGRQLASWLPVFDDAGLSLNVEAFSLKVAGADGSFDFTNVQNAIEAGITNGIHLFNLSLFGPYSQLLQEDLSKPERTNSTLFVVAAGNDGADLDVQKAQHRTFRDKNSSGLSNVIFVAALADDGKLADFSAHGKSLVQIAAPGVEISSTVHSAGFGTLSGTSQAAPLVTLTAAILKAENPNMLPLALKHRILDTCDWDKDLEDQVANGCKLNLLKAVVCGSDLLQFKRGGALLRGEIDRRQFVSGTPVDSSLVRVWIPTPATALYVYSSGKREQRNMTGKFVSIKLHDGETCPVQLTDGMCTLGTSDGMDIIFRLK